MTTRHPSSRVALVGAVVLSTACIELDRAQGLGEGELRVTVVDAAGAAVAGAVASAEGTERLAVSDASGLAVIRGPLPVGDYVVRVEQRGGDGAVIAAGFAGGSIRRAPVRGLDRLTASELGVVVLAPTVRVSGVVSGCGDDLCRVVVARTVSLPSARDVVLPVEAAGGVQADGSFSVQGIAPGSVTLVALAAPRASSPQPLQQLVAASRPSRFATVSVALAGDATVDLDVAVAVPTAGVTVSGTVLAEVDVARLSGRADFLIPGQTTDVTAGVFASVTAGAIAGAAPLSVFDLNVQTDAGVVVKVPRVVAFDGADYLPAVLGQPAACPGLDGVDGAVDCDGDGVDDALDDDTDADGVPDANEPTACVGGNRGVDADGDCLCDLVDPFPGCASNDPVDCTLPTPLTCE